MDLQPTAKHIKVISHDFPNTIKVVEGLSVVSPVVASL